MGAGVVDRGGVDLLRGRGAAGQVDCLIAVGVGRQTFGLPARAAVVAAENAASGGIGGVKHRLTIFLELDEITDETGKRSGASVGPGRATVGGLVDTRASDEVCRAAADGKVQLLGIGDIWIDDERAEFGQVEMRVGQEAPVGSSILRAENAAARTGGRREDDVGIPRKHDQVVLMDRQRQNLRLVGQLGPVRLGVEPVGRFPDSAVGGADVHHVGVAGIRRRHVDAAGKRAAAHAGRGANRRPFTCAQDDRGAAFSLYD